MYLLDTNIISELWKLSRGKADPVFESWFRRYSEKPLYISVVTLMELERGVLAMERKDPIQGAYLREWFLAVREKFQKRTLVIDGAVADCCAGLHVPDKSAGERRMDRCNCFDSWSYSRNAQCQDLSVCMFGS